MKMKKYPATLEAQLMCDGTCGCPTPHSFSHYVALADESNGHDAKQTLDGKPRGFVYACSYCDTERMWGNANLLDDEMLFGMGGGRARN